MTRSPRTRRRLRVAALGLIGVATLAGAGAAVHAVAIPAGAPSPRAAAAAARTPSRPPLAIRAQPARRTVGPGATATFAIRVSRGSRLMRPAGHSHGRRRLATLVSLQALRPLPRGVTATLRPKATRSTHARLTLRAAPSVRPGTYRVRLSAKGRLGTAPRHRRAYARTFVTLVVTPTPVSGSFTIGGSPAAPLAPGRVLALDLVLSNPHAHALRIEQIAVRVAAVRAPRADLAHSCSARDFAVLPYTDPDGFTLPARAHMRLSALGVPSWRRPRIAMLNRAVNQDGCKQATLTLRFDGRSRAAH